MNRQLILGPPGTGKTTALLDIVDECLKAGIQPDRIAYVSFTQKAAYEARDRAVERFDYKPGDFPYFRTLHSMASRIMGLKKDDFMYAANYKEVGEAAGTLNLTGKKMDFSTEERVTNTANHLLSMIDIARNKKLSFEEYLRTLPEIARHYAIARNGKLAKTLFAELEAYKATYGLFDFTDLIVTPVRDEYPPLDIDVAIVDEAQDLTAVQWDFVNHFFRRAKRLFIAGDDDQAIYEWNGADVNQFLHLQGEKRTLSKSYRLPRRPWILTNALSNRITERYSKDWTHNGDEGEVIKVESYKTAHVLEGGQWMILARNNAYLKNVQQWLVSKGVPIRRNDYAVIDPEHISAIHGWVALSEGRSISGIRAKQLYNLMTTQHQIGYGGKIRIEAADDDAEFCYDELRDEFALIADITRPWWENLERIPQEKRDYYRRMKSNGESMKNPRVLLSTIHGVKGGEAENVLLLPDMARQTNRMFMAGRGFSNEEHRVFYVGASRAKRRLFICKPQAQAAYPFPSFSS